MTSRAPTLPKETTTSVRFNRDWPPLAQPSTSCANRSQVTRVTQARTLRCRPTKGPERDSLDSTLQTWRASRTMSNATRPTSRGALRASTPVAFVSGSRLVTSLCRGVAAALVALCLTGCGDTLPPAIESPIRPALRATGPACPCDLAVYEVLEAGRFGDAYYRVDQEGAAITLRQGAVTTSIPTTLDSLTAVALWQEIEEGEDPLGLLFVAGCREQDSILVVFGDSDSDGLLDEKLGEYELDAMTRAMSIAYRFGTRETFISSEVGTPVVRLVDTTGDYIPDSSGAYSVPGTSVPSGYEHFEIEPGGVLIGFGRTMLTPDTPVLVFVDANYDGVPESMSETTWAVHRQAPPTFVFEPMVGDSSLSVRGAPGSVVELWDADSTGAKSSSNPAVARLGTTTLSNAGTGAISFSWTLVEGEYLALFDTTLDTAGAHRGILATFPRVESITPQEIDQGTGGTVTIHGAGFVAGTKVELQSPLDPQVGISLTPTVVDGSTMTVTVPTLSTDEWCWSARVFVYADVALEGGRSIRLGLR